MIKPLFKQLMIISIIVLMAYVFSAIAFNRSVTTVAHRQLENERLTVIIDAGHGGEDGGTTSCSGVLESRINLEIATRLNDLLHLLGHKTKMIRTTDVSVYTSGTTLSQKKISDLKERVRITNETDPALLISIHQNHYTDSRYSGAQVFYAPTPGSKEFAQKMQNAFRETINRNSNRNIKKAEGIYFMQNIDCTGVLIECGFLSNPQEETQLRDEAYQKKICCLIASVINQN